METSLTVAVVGADSMTCPRNPQYCPRQNELNTDAKNKVKNDNVPWCQLLQEIVEERRIQHTNARAVSRTAKKPENLKYCITRFPKVRGWNGLDEREINSIVRKTQLPRSVNWNTPVLCVTLTTMENDLCFALAKCNIMSVSFRFNHVNNYIYI